MSDGRSDAPADPPRRSPPTEQDLWDAFKPVPWAHTLAADLNAAVSAAITDASPFERAMAVMGEEDDELGPLPTQVRAWALALREARPLSENMTDDQWEAKVELFWRRLPDKQRRDPRLIMAKVEALRDATRSRPREARGFTERQIRVATQTVRVRMGRTPTIAEVAAELSTSDSTLGRAMYDLEMGSWPPAPPDD